MGDKYSKCHPVLGIHVLYKAKKLSLVIYI